MPIRVVLWPSRLPAPAPKPRLVLVEAMPLLVEAGVLLDLTVGVFVLGIIVDRIQRAFDSLDTRKLTVLRE